ncbi:MAG: hypothetical protein QMD14_01325 [Candidatus Aenigmarchaeota archaeon]|nr:hypothetical protein [Candidatus Aenigmarchaeota archaeon]
MLKKAQIALEYIIVVAFAIGVLTPILLYVNQSLNEYREGNNLILAKNSVTKIGQIADWVFSQGPPAKMEIEVYIPQGIEEIRIEEKVILFRIKTSAGISDVYYLTLSNVSGSISPIPGYTKVKIEAFETNVTVSD